MTEDDSITWREQARGRGRLAQSFEAQIMESACPFLLSVAQASFLPLLGLITTSVKWGKIVSTSLGGGED